MGRLLTDLRGLQGAGTGACRRPMPSWARPRCARRPDARQQYLESEMVKNRSNPELFQFLERLLALVRPASADVHGTRAVYFPTPPCYNTPN